MQRVIFLVFCMLSFQALAIELNFNSGIYFEKFDKVFISNEEWKLLTQIDFKTYINYHHEIEAIFNHSRKICENSNLFEQCHFLVVMHDDLRDIQEKNELIESYLGDSNYSNKSKRGLLNIVGSTLKFLFGTLDSEDEQKLINLKSENKNLIHVASEQVSIFKNVFHEMNETYHSDLIIMRNVSQQINSIRDSLLNFDQVIRNNTRHLELIMNFENNLVFFESLVNKFRDYQKILFESLEKAKEGKLHPSILSYQKLFLILKEAEQQLPKYLMFPFTLTQQYNPLIYSLINPTIFQFNDTIQFHLNIPLIHTTSYDLIKATAVPVHQRDARYAYINIRQPYLAVDHLGLYFFQMEENQLRSCIAAEHGYICRQHITVFSASEVNCVYELYKNVNSLPDICEKNEIVIRNTLFLELLPYNSYIYISYKKEIIYLHCEKQNQNIINIKLNSSGVITFKPCCKIYNQYFFFYSKCRDNFNLKNKILAFTPDNINICSITNTKLMFSLPNELNTSKLIVIHKNQNLNTLEKELNTLEHDTTNLTNHHIHHYLTIYIIMFFLLIAMLTFLIKRKFIDSKRRVTKSENELKEFQKTVDTIESSNITSSFQL